MPNTGGSSRRTHEHLSYRPKEERHEISSSDAGATAAQNFDAAKLHYDTSHDASAQPRQDTPPPSLFKQVQARIQALVTEGWSYDEAEGDIWNNEFTDKERLEYSQQRLDHSITALGQDVAAAAFQRKVQAVVDKYGKNPTKDLSEQGQLIRSYVGEEVHNKATVFVRLYQAQQDGAKNQYVLRILSADIRDELFRCYKQCQDASKSISEQQSAD